MITRKIFFIAAGLFIAIAMQAKERPDTALQNRYYRLFYTESADSAKAFYNLSARVQNFYKQRRQSEEYYNVKRIEVRYEADRGRYMEALKKANDLLAEMKRNKDERYSDIAYCALGTVYDRQGNHEMGIRYFNEALKKVTPADGPRYVHAYAGLEHCYIIQHPEKALQMNEKFGELIKTDSTYLKVYLAHKVQIYFYMDDKQNFLKAAKEYEQLINNTELPKYQYGAKTIGVMENAMTDKHNEVLRGLENYSDNIRRMDASIRIYEKMGRQDLALKEAYKRMEIQDSFDSYIFAKNEKELDTIKQIKELQEKAAKEREFWMIVVIVLLVIAVALIVSRYLIRRHYQKKVMMQKEQLAIALDEAQESARMKTAFIKHVSHEMRTPLNIINGYTQLIADPKYELSKEERDTLLQVIDQNTLAITSTINDLLEISLDSSKERYQRDDRIVVNDLCRSAMAYAYRRDNGRLEFVFNSTLPDDYTINSNNEGIERILRQLLKNSLKFTEKGKIELSVYESADGESVHFAVTDTGIGIPKEHRNQVFEEFYKVDSFKQGLGVGLPMSRKIAIRLGGTLDIDEDYKEGTRMILTIPRGG